MLLHTLIGNSVEYIDGLIVKAHFVDDKVFAVFRWGARELPISLLFVGAVMTAMIPKVVENQEAGLAIMKQKVDELSRWLYPLSIGLMLLSPLLFPIVYNEDFTESARIFNVYLLVLSSRILLPQVVILSAEKNFILVACAIVEVIINIVLSLIWVKSFGLIGIAFASVIAFLVFKIMLITFNYRQLNIPVTRYISIGKYFGYNLLLFASFILSEMIYS